MTIAKQIEVLNKVGLHARPAMQFAEVAMAFASAILVQKIGEGACEVDGKSVMQMITLEAGCGTQLVIKAEGDDAQAAVDALADLFANKFGEE